MITLLTLNTFGMMLCERYVNVPIVGLMGQNYVCKRKASMKVNMRFHNTMGVTYIRKEDVVNYIRELASYEETDVRWRLEEAARNIDMLGKTTTVAKAILLRGEIL